MSLSLGPRFPGSKSLPARPPMSSSSPNAQTKPSWLRHALTAFGPLIGLAAVVCAICGAALRHLRFAGQFRHHPSADRRHRRRGARHDAHHHRRRHRPVGRLGHRPRHRGHRPVVAKGRAAPVRRAGRRCRRRALRRVLRPADHAAAAAPLRRDPRHDGRAARRGQGAWPTNSRSIPTRPG